MVIECEQCGEPCADSVRACPLSGLMLCGECSYDETIAGEERYYARLDGDVKAGSDG